MSAEIKNYKAPKTNTENNDAYEIKGDKNLSIKQYREKIKPYLRNMIDELKKLGEWKIQLIMNINLFYQKIKVKNN